MAVPKFVRSIIPTKFDYDWIDNKSKETGFMSQSTTRTPSLALQLNREENRLKSLERWNVPFIDKHQLAKVGFYYMGTNDLVKCYFCCVEIGMWEDGDNVLSEHLRWSPSCPLMRKMQTNNVPIDNNYEAYLEMPSVDTCGFRMNVSNEYPMRQNPNPNSNDSSLSSSLTSTGSSSESDESIPQETIKRPDHPEYRLEVKRLATFKEWPKTMKQKPKQLSDAGLYYIGKGDRVKCFSCGGGLKDWEEYDDPWEQHAMWYNNCEYVKLMKDNEYIQRCLAKKNATVTEQSLARNAIPNLPSTSRSTAASTEEKCGTIVSEPGVKRPCESSSEDDEINNKTVSEGKLCKICYACDYNTAFFPCGHVIACAKCASSVTKCPLCRQPFTNVLRLYMS